MRYDLMHKDIPVLTCDIDYGHITKLIKIHDAAHAPVGTYDKNGIVRKQLIDWFDRRSIPASRDGIRETLKRLNIQTTSELLEKSYGFSLSDQYWIKPSGSDLCWENLNFFINRFSDDLGTLLFGEQEKNIDSTDIDLLAPDNTSDGWLQKKWKIIHGKRCLLKSGSAPFYQEPLNEKIASVLCERLGIDHHVDYKLKYKANGKPYSICEDYITEHTELVTAYAMCSLAKQRGSESDYQHYVNVCKQVGLDEITENLDRTICIDYLMANTDRHWTNFGVVRDADTLAFLEPFPIYDNGTSLWNNTVETMIGREPVIGKMFGTPLERHLKYVQDASFMDFSKLYDFPEYVEEILHSSPYMMDSRISMIKNMVYHQIKNLDQELASKKMSVNIEKQGDKAISWSPVKEKIEKKRKEIISAVSKIPGINVKDFGKELHLTTRSGLDMKYYFETEILAVKISRVYVDLSTLKNSEITLMSHATSVIAIATAIKTVSAQLQQSEQQQTKQC